MLPSSLPGRECLYYSVASYELCLNENLCVCDFSSSFLRHSSDSLISLQRLPSSFFPVPSTFTLHDIQLVIDGSCPVRNNFPSRNVKDRFASELFSFHLFNGNDAISFSSSYRSRLTLILAGVLPGCYLLRNCYD